MRDSTDLIVPLGFKEITETEDAILQWHFEPEVSKPGILALSKPLQWITVTVMILRVVYYHVILWKC